MKKLIFTLFIALGLAYPVHGAVVAPITTLQAIVNEFDIQLSWVQPAPIVSSGTFYVQRSSWSGVYLSTTPVYMVAVTTQSAKYASNVVDIASGTVLSLTVPITTLERGSTYYYSIAYVNGVDKSTTSNSTSLHITPIVGGITDLLITPEYAHTQARMITWTQPSGYSMSGSGKYYILRSTWETVNVSSVTAQYTLSVSSVAAGSAQYLNVFLPRGTTYYFNIMYTNGVTYSTWSNVTDCYFSDKNPIFSVPVSTFTNVEMTGTFKIYESSAATNPSFSIISGDVDADGSITSHSGFVCPDGTIITSTSPFLGSADLTQLGIDTGTLRTDLNVTRIATGTISGILYQVGIDTGTLASRSYNLEQSTGTLVPYTGANQNVSIGMNDLTTGATIYADTLDAYTLRVSTILGHSPIHIIADEVTIAGSMAVQDDATGDYYSSSHIKTLNQYALTVSTDNYATSTSPDDYSVAITSSGDINTKGDIDSLGIITGTYLKGNGSQITDIIVSSIQASGTNSNTTFLRGDFAWSAIDLTQLNSVVSLTATSATITSSNFSVGGSTLVTRLGNVGIGCVSPGTKLQVSSGVISNDGAGAGITTTGDVTAANFIGSATGVGAIKLYDTDASNYVTIKASASHPTNNIFIMPTVEGRSLQALLADGTGGNYYAHVSSLQTGAYENIQAGTATVANSLSAAAGSLYGKLALANTWDQTQTLNLGVYASTGAFTSDVSVGGNLAVTGTLTTYGTGAGTNILYDADNSNYVTISASPTCPSNVTLYLPTANGSAGQAMVTDGTGGHYYTTLITTFTPNIIHIGGDVLIASGTFNPLYGDLYRVAGSTWYITGLEFYNFGTSSVGSTYYNLAYSSSTGATVTWQYVSAYNVEVSTDGKTSGMVACNFTVPPGSWLALHITGIPASGTLPNEFGVVVRYYRID